MSSEEKEKLKEEPSVTVECENNDNKPNSKNLEGKKSLKPDSNQ